jgi:hypothetical protein
MHAACTKRFKNAGKLTREQACSGNEIVKNIKDEKRKFGFERVEAFTSSIQAKTRGKTFIDLHYIFNAF